MNGRMSSVISVKSLEDYQVLDVRGEALGEIEDVLLDGKLGTARYFVLSLGASALGLHKTRFAVPADCVRLDTENEALVIDVGPERFERATPFEEADGSDASAIYRL